MSTYLVDRNVPGVTRDQFRAAQRALGQASRRSSESGRAVCYLRALFVPSEGRAMCLFEAPDAESVRAVNVAAGVPFSHVVEAVDLIVELDHFPEGVDKAMRILVSTVVAALSLAAFSVGSVSAAPNSTDKTVRIIGEEKFSPDAFFSITYRFSPRRTRVHQGDRITWDNQTTDGHTVSVVAREQLPKTVQQIDNCSVCNDLLAAHFPNGFPPQGTPVLVLDDFRATTAPARFDSVGDSVIVAPPGLGVPTRVTVTVSAQPGTTLDYMCAFHSWMQGSIQIVASGDSTED